MKKKLKMSMGTTDSPKNLEEFTGSKDTVRLTIDLPSDAHGIFKSNVALIKPKTNMTEITKELIYKYIGYKPKTS